MKTKDYKIIAECLRKATTKEEILDNLLVELKRDNASFNKDSFIKASTKEE